MAGRGFSSAAYRFGFNNQEKDGELGDSYAFEYRIHDARLGRFLSVDPLGLKFPWNSPFTFAENRIIEGIEFEGLEVILLGGRWSAASGVAVSGETGVMIDFSGNLYGYASGSLGLETNASVSWEISVTVFGTMQDYHDALGWGQSAGVSLGEGLVGGVSLVRSSGYYGLNFHAGVGVGLSPISVSANVSYTAAKDLTEADRESTLRTLGQATFELTLKINEYNCKIQGLQVDNQNLDYDINSKELKMNDGALSIDQKTIIASEIESLKSKQKENNDLIRSIEDERDEFQETQNIVNKAIDNLNNAK
jgi:RHS repeat-associated protein